MNYDWIEKYCLEKMGTYKKYKEEWEAHLYMIDNKYFIMHGRNKEGREILTFKLKEDTNVKIQKENPTMIVPGYYCNKKLWSSVYLDMSPSKELLQLLVDESYEVLFKGFSKKRQNEILEGIL